MTIPVRANDMLLAAATAHRACCSEEHNPALGKIHGYCVVCGVPWPCKTAAQFMINVGDYEPETNLTSDPPGDE